MASSSMATAKSLLSTIGSTAAAIMVARSVVNDFLPYEVRNYLYSSIYSVFNRRFSSEISEITMIIEEFDGLESNQIFEATQLFIGARTKIISTSSSTSATRLKVRKHESHNHILVNVDKNEEIVDEFEGIKYRWMLHCRTVESKNNFYNPSYTRSASRSEVRSFHLTFNKKFKDVTIEKYLPYILKQAEFLKMETKTLKLYTIDVDKLYVGNFGNAWKSISLNHPATFDTVVLDTDLKSMIIEDLDRFLKRKDYYRHVGKVWQRGYLLYGPPGTGKSSLIAAMANYLNFDVYDLVLSGFRSDSELRNALVRTANKSILVVEDIDCSIELSNREGDGNGHGSHIGKKVTISGFLNLIDGLWLSCGDERIIIFTTNYKEKLDPALLRPGRMVLHIHMSYCTPCGFKLLANNYLGVKHHELFTDIEKLIEKINVTPAEVAEHLMKHERPDQALKGLLEFLELKRVGEANVAEAKKVENESKTKEKNVVVNDSKSVQKPIYKQLYQVQDCC